MTLVKEVKFSRFCYACINDCIVRRMVLKKDGERGKAAEQVKDDAKKMSNCFLRLSHATNPKVREHLQIGFITLTSFQC